jgi:hypothetical protein
VVEHSLRKRKVEGSIPFGGKFFKITLVLELSIFLKYLKRFSFFEFLKMNHDPHTTRLIEQVESGILQVAKAEEEKLDAKLRSLENLGELICEMVVILYIFRLDEDDFEAIRQKRRAQLQKQTQQEQVWKHQGHGV